MVRPTERKTPLSISLAHTVQHNELEHCCRKIEVEVKFCTWCEQVLQKQERTVATVCTVSGGRPEDTKVLIRLLIIEQGGKTYTAIARVEDVILSQPFYPVAVLS